MWKSTARWTVGGSDVVGQVGTENRKRLGHNIKWHQVQLNALLLPGLLGYVQRIISLAKRDLPCTWQVQLTCEMVPGFLLLCVQNSCGAGVGRHGYSHSDPITFPCLEII